MKRVIKASKDMIGNPRASEYYQYLLEHINGVRRSWNEILEPAILSNLDEFDCTVEEITAAGQCVNYHDNSKYEDDEYIPYLNYFYPDGRYDKDEAAFDKAWWLHQKRNPHHWQYWVLIRDEGQTVAIDMPFEYICEMLCDWHSFTLRDPKSTAKKWWTDNKSKMILSSTTKDTINKLIKYMDTPLQLLNKTED